MANTNIIIPVDADLKVEAEELFSELGLDLSTAVNLFIKQAIRLGKIPFEIAVDRPNKETIEAMLEANQIINDPNVKSYTDIDELFNDLEAECYDS